MRDKGKSIQSSNEVEDEIYMFDLDKNGNFIASPLVRFGSAMIVGPACLLRLEFARATSELDQSAVGIQLTMTPEQAVEIGTELLEMARLIQEMNKDADRPG